MRIIKISLYFCIVLLLSFSIFSGITDDRERNLGDPDKHLYLKIYIEENTLKKLTELGVAADHTERSSDGTYALAYLNGAEVKMMKNAGVRFDILSADWYEDYLKLPAVTNEELSIQKAMMKDAHNVTGFSLGSMGGYLTHNEAIAKIDSMRLEYPSFISAKFSIGTTIEGRPIWAYRITKDPDLPSTKPQLFLNAVTHAREPIGMMNLIYYSYYLLENYYDDVTVKYLLDNRDIYILPFVNSDGYIYNQTIAPSGGGLWRKNRRNNGGSFGVDLNRNFGTLQFWNSSNGGSSTDPSIDTYRGTAPFSEPETQAIQNLVNSKNFRNSFYYHAFGNYYIYPWAWIDPQETPDSAYFRRFTGEMRTHNNFTTGTNSQTLLYLIRGGCDDWMYNDSGHSRVISILPEVGGASDGFWPQQNRIVPLVMQQVKPNLFYTGVTDTFVQYKGSQLLPAQTLNGGDTARFYINVKSVGLRNASNITAVITPADTLTTVVLNNRTFGSFNFFETRNNQASPFAIRVKNNIPAGAQTKILVNLKIGVQAATQDTIIFTLGTPSSIVSLGTVPDKYFLSPNYPNPFNPSTNITFGVPMKGLVTIRVFDLLGKEAALLINEVKDAGSYSLKFNAHNLSSGIYYYRIESGDYIETKKMLLVK